MSPLESVFGITDEALIRHVTTTAQAELAEEYFPFWQRKFCLYNAETKECGGEAYVWQYRDITSNTL